MGYWNDNAAFIGATGNLSLGGGVDDAAQHATYPWAKNDVTLPVAASHLISDTLPALTYSVGDIPMRVLAASTTHKVTVPMPQWLIRTYQGRATAGQNVLAPHGILVKSLALNYRVNTTTITSFATMAINSAPLAAGAAIPAVTVMTSTLAGNTLTAAANAYLAVSTVTTPGWLNVADTLIWAVATIVVPGSSTVDLFGASWRIAYAMY